MKSIDIEKMKSKLLDIVGNDNEVSIWSSRIFMPFTALPDNIKKNMNNNLNITFILHNKNKNFESDIKKIKENSTKILGKASINYEGEIQTENVVENLVISPDKIYIIALVGYIVSMIYAVNIVIFWIEKRKYEIGLRKALGYKNKDIGILILGEMLEISICSIVITLILQFVVQKLFGKIMGYSLQIYWMNLFVGGVVVLITSVITSVAPILRALKIQPVEILRKG